MEQFVKLIRLLFTETMASWSVLVWEANSDLFIL